jgi:hypothetical protein
MSHGAIAMEDKMPEQNGKTPVKKKKRQENENLRLGTDSSEQTRPRRPTSTRHI